VHRSLEDEREEHAKESGLPTRTKRLVKPQEIAQGIAALASKVTRLWRLSNTLSSVNLMTIDLLRPASDTDLNSTNANALLTSLTFSKIPLTD
jgi:hypothetical protein